MAALVRSLRVSGLAHLRSLLRREPGKDAFPAGLRDKGASGIASSSLMLLAVDRQMRMQDASEKALRVLGYSRGELLALRVPDLVGDGIPIEEMFAEYLAAGEQRGRITLRRKDGTTVEAGYHGLVMEIASESYLVCLLVPDSDAAAETERSLSSAGAPD